MAARHSRARQPALLALAAIEEDFEELRQETRDARDSWREVVSVIRSMQTDQNNFRSEVRGIVDRLNLEVAGHKEVVDAMVRTQTAILEELKAIKKGLAKKP